METKSLDAVQGVFGLLLFYSPILYLIMLY